MRDKLIELLENLEQEKALFPDERAADYLIANGVTFVTDTNVGDKPMTNADRIRAMSDRELAEFICKHSDCGVCEFGKPFRCLLSDWLKQPIGEEA